MTSHLEGALGFLGDINGLTDLDQDYAWPFSGSPSIYLNMVAPYPRFLGNLAGKFTVEEISE